MSRIGIVNRRIVLAAHPHGLPTPQSFRLEQTAVPTPNEGQVLLRTLYLSLDPYMRQLMNEVGPVYAPSVKLGEPMVGGTVNRVVASRHPDFRVGDLHDGMAATHERSQDGSTSNFRDEVFEGISAARSEGRTEEPNESGS